MKKNLSISIVGSGKVAQALVQGFLHSGFEASLITVYARTESKFIPYFVQKVQVETSYESISESDVIILAIIPSAVKDVLGKLRTFLPKKEIPIISFVSTLTISRMKMLFGRTGDMFVRGMLNTNCDVGNGIFVFGIIGHQNEMKLRNEFLGIIFGCCGRVEYVRGVHFLDKAVAGYGSMNAYTLSMLSGSVRGLEAIGYSEKEAVYTALITMQSAVQAMLSKGDFTKQAIIDRIATVTTKGGCTEECAQYLLDLFQKEMDTVMRKTHHKAMSFKALANT